MNPVQLNTQSNKSKQEIKPPGKGGFFVARCLVHENVFKARSRSVCPVSTKPPSAECVTPKAGRDEDGGGVLFTSGDWRHAKSVQLPSGAHLPSPALGLRHGAVLKAFDG